MAHLMLRGEVPDFDTWKQDVLDAVQCAAGPSPLAREASDAIVCQPVSMVCKSHPRIVGQRPDAFRSARTAPTS
jgi:hypothetical protein